MFFTTSRLHFTPIRLIAFCETVKIQVNRSLRGAAGVSGDMACRTPAAYKEEAYEDSKYAKQPDGAVCPVGEDARAEAEGTGIG